jgi:hypothetical protein
MFFGPERGVPDLKQQKARVFRSANTRQTLTARGKAQPRGAAIVNSKMGTV